MEPVIPDLYASAPRPLPFAPSLAMRTFLCRRDEGNVLVHASGELDAEAGAIERLGGASRLYLNHGHEAEFIPAADRPRTLIHEADREEAARAAGTLETFSERHLLGADFEVIPTPGHTPGATAYLWDSGEHRVLFTGDTIYVREGEWVAAVLESSDREAYGASLEVIRELDFDLLVPWITTYGQAHHVATDRADARRRIDAILERLA